MQRPRHELLSGAGRAENQHVSVSPSRKGNVRSELPGGSRLADEAVGVGVFERMLGASGRTGEPCVTGRAPEHEMVTDFENVSGANLVSVTQSPIHGYFSLTEVRHLEPIGSDR